jgi:hypothetical protein
MTTDPIQHALLILASSPLTAADLRELSRWLAAGQASNLSRHIERIRREAASLASAGEMHAVSPIVTKDSHSSPAISVAARLELIRNELQFTDRQFLERLHIRLASDYPSIPEAKRASLYSWTERALAHAPMSSVLKAAYDIRQLYGRGNETDWPLQDQ